MNPKPQQKPVNGKRTAQGAIESLLQLPPVTLITISDKSSHPSLVSPRRKTVVVNQANSESWEVT